MNVWLVTIGEPLPFGAGRKDRMLRTGFMARLMAEQGHKVTWWTSAFDHFKKTHVVTTSQTVDVSANLSLRLLKGKGYRRNISLARFLDHRELARIFRSEIEVQEPPQIILASVPTVEMGLAAAKYGRKRGIPVVLDLRDMWPDIFVDHAAPWLRPAVRALLAPFFLDARAACAEATALIGITDEFLEWGLRRGRRSKSKWDRVFPLAYTTDEPDQLSLRQANTFWDDLKVGSGETLTACFVGTMNAQYDVAGILRAAAILDRPDSAVRFVLCGLGDRLADYKRAAERLSNVVFPGWVDYPKIYSLLRRVQVGLDPIPSRYDYLASINNKAIEYFSAGLPVVSSPDSGVLAALLATNDCGVSYPGGDGEALARMLLELASRPDRLTAMGQNSRRVFNACFRADVVYGEFAAYLSELAEAGAPA